MTLANCFRPLTYGCAHSPRRPTAVWRGKFGTWLRAMEVPSRPVSQQRTRNAQIHRRLGDQHLSSSGLLTSVISLSAFRRGLGGLKWSAAWNTHSAPTSDPAAHRSEDRIFRPRTTRNPQIHRRVEDQEIDICFFWPPDFCDFLIRVAPRTPRPEVIRGLEHPLGADQW